MSSAEQCPGAKAGGDSDKRGRNCKKQSFQPVRLGRSLYQGPNNIIRNKKISQKGEGDQRQMNEFRVSILEFGSFHHPRHHESPDFDSIIWIQALCAP